MKIAAKFTALFVLCLFMAGRSTAQEGSAAPPNVVVIVADDLGYGDTGCYGNTQVLTPNIDALAREGMRFTQFYAASSCCSPSRAALLTGQYPDLVGVPGLVGRPGASGSWGYFNRNAVLLPDVLKAKSYHSALIGKWHLGQEEGQRPTQRGFDQFQGYLTGMLSTYNLDKITKEAMQSRFLHNEQPITLTGHATETLTDWALEYLDARAADTRPFFLLLSHFAPHIPVQPPQEFEERVQKRLPGETLKKTQYIAFVEHLDQEIGRFMEGLRTRGLQSNTLVLFVSDNGGYLQVGADNGPLRGGKMTMFEGGLRVPFIACWPGSIAAGTTCNDPTMMMDIMPTICDYAGIQIAQRLDGRSFRPLLEGTAESLPERTLIWPWRGSYHSLDGNAVYAVRRGDWKVFQTSSVSKYNLVNLIEDPAEENPSFKKSELKQELLKTLKHHIQLSGAVPWQAPIEEIERARATMSEEELNAGEEILPELDAELEE